MSHHVKEGCQEGNIQSRHLFISNPGIDKPAANRPTLNHNSSYAYMAAAAAAAAATALPIPRFSSSPAPAPASVGAAVGTFNFSIPAVTVNAL